MQSGVGVAMQWKVKWEEHERQDGRGLGGQVGLHLGRECLPGYPYQGHKGAWYELNTKTLKDILGMNSYMLYES